MAPFSSFDPFPQFNDLYLPCETPPNLEKKQ